MEATTQMSIEEARAAIKAKLDSIRAKHKRKLKAAGELETEK